eukprot:scaffold137738_cov29-Tisochrysis_lutea.AAC.4
MSKSAKPSEAEPDCTAGKKASSASEWLSRRRHRSHERRALQRSRASVDCPPSGRPRVADRARARRQRHSRAAAQLRRHTRNVRLHWAARAYLRPGLCWLN